MKLQDISKKQMITAGAAALLVITAGCGMAFSRSGGIAVNSVSVQYGSLEDTYTEEGVIRDGQEVHILANVSGSVKEVVVQENDAIQSGDILFLIDSRDYLYEKELHQSALAGYQAQLEQSNINQVMAASPQEYLDSLVQDQTSGLAVYESAVTQWNAADQLYAAGVIAKTEWEQAKAAYESAKSAYGKAKNRLDESKRQFEALKKEGLTDLDINEKFYQSTKDQLNALVQSEQTTMDQLDLKIQDCEIRAEADGIITSLPGKNLSMVQVGQELVVINQMSQGLTVESEVLTTIAPYLAPGDPVVVTLKLRGRDQTYQGTIAKIYDFASQSTSALGLNEYRVKVKIAVAEPVGETAVSEMSLKDGYGVDVAFTLYRATDKLLVPAGAVFRFQNQDYVYTLEDSRAVKTAVQVEYKSGTQAVIVEGLTEQALIISNVDSEGIYDGVKVK